MDLLEDFYKEQRDYLNIFFLYIWPIKVLL